jgi:hypothetical protein
MAKLMRFGWNSLELVDDAMEKAIMWAASYSGIASNLIIKDVQGKTFRAGNSSVFFLSALNRKKI